MSGQETARMAGGGSWRANSRATRTRRRGLGPAQSWWGVVFTLPMLGLLVGFKFWPMAYAGWLSLTDANLTEPARHFIGAHNYARLIRDTAFVGALKTTGRYVGETLAISMVLGLGLA